MTDIQRVILYGGHDVSLSQGYTNPGLPRMKTSAFTAVAAAMLLTHFASSAGAGVPRQTEGGSDYMSSPEEGATLNWLTLTITDIFSFGFNNRENEREVGEEHFTPEGWREMTSIVENLGGVDATIRKAVYACAVPEEAPVIIGFDLDEKTYKVRLPVIISYTAADAKATKRVALEIRLSFSLVEGDYEPKIDGVYLDELITVRR